MQVVGLERIAIVVPAEAIGQFQSALGTCQDQHASGIVSTARVQPQPQLPTPNPPSNPGCIPAVPMAPCTASGPCTPSHADLHNQISPQVKLCASTPTSTSTSTPVHACGVQLMEHPLPLMFQPMWILPSAGASAPHPSVTFPTQYTPTFAAVHTLKQHFVNQTDHTSGKAMVSLNCW